MPISEDHPAVEAGVEADFLWNKASPAEAVAAILNAALPHIRNALLDELAEEAETTLANGQSAARYLRSKKEPRDV